VIHVFLWWLIAQALGWAGLPLAYAFFRWLPDRGYTFARAVGLLLASYLLWVGASTGVLRNDDGGILFAILLAAALSLAIYTRSKRNETAGFSLAGFLSGHKGLVFTVEILFLLAFAAWAILRAYAPDKIMNTGGEKFMEIAFLNGVLNSQSFPPLDPWLSGFSISYYYFGYVMMALLTQLSGVFPAVGFDLYDALLFALTAQGAFGVVYNLVAGAGVAGPAGHSKAIEYGLLGALFVAVLGNLEGLLESFHSKGILPASFWSWIDIPGLEGGTAGGSWFPGGGGGWWWWQASRVVQDRDLLNRLIDVSPITEFPFFSFLLGDNHPHVLALPFVLLAIGVALNLLRRQLYDGGQYNPLTIFFNGDWLHFLISALFLGALGFLNTWDLPIYVGLAVLAYAAGLAACRKRFDAHFFLRVGALGAGLFLASLLLYAFFYISFSSQAAGLLPYIFPPTRLPQYLVMFGTFAFIVACFLVTDLFGRDPQARREAVRSFLKWWAGILLASVAFFGLLLAMVSLSGQARQLVEQMRADPASPLGGLDLGGLLQAIVVYRLRDPWLLLCLSALLAFGAAGLFGRLRRFPISGDNPAEPGHSPSHLFALLLSLLGLLLTFSVEFFYLRDQFGVRMNTVFKFYYQAWVMLGCASAYGLWWVLEGGAQPGRLRQPGQAWRAFVLAGSSLLILASLVYPVMGYYSRAQGFQASPDLNAAATVAGWNPDDWAAIEWLRQNGRPDRGGEAPTILEAPGKSYNYEGRVSAFTGFPAVLGWALHEGQWRGSYDEQARRETDIAAIYTTYDGRLALDLLEKWDVSYVIVGNAERQYVETLCRAPDRACVPRRALAKFDQILEPAFSQGSTIVYRVPGSSD
jgi:YYY domain-containing protein